MSVILTDDFLRGVTPLTDKQQEEIHLPTDLWSDDFAVKVAVQDFGKAEAYRTQNCDWRWRTANELYQAWVQQKYWEGTRIPRASIGVFVAFEQIESMLPKILSAIFADNPWFQSDPLPGTTAEQARAWGDHIRDQMDRTDVREVMRRWVKSALTFGNGIMKLSWISQEREKLEWLPKWQQRQSMMGNRPQFERVLSKQKVKYIENRPVLEWVNLGDFYIDPNCPSPNIQHAQYVVERKMVTVADLEALRDVKPFKIPSTATLNAMANYKPTTQGDSTKSTSELFRLGSWYPANDQTVDPGGKRIEVLEYQTEERVVQVANRNTAILNIPNSYGFKTYYDACYADVLGRFYGMGVCDIVEGEQRLQQALVNGRLDELSLALHRPMIKKLGIKTPTYALRVRPGQIWEAEDPSKDYQFLKVDNITANAYVESQASELRVQKTTGMSDMFAQGVPASGGNSANRTATGIGQQAQAGSERIRYLVENLENTGIEPMLNDVVTLNKMFPPIGTSMADVVALSKIQLSMRASAKMQSRASLMQAFPLIFQTLANPGLMQELAASGLTVEWKEAVFMLLDMTGYKNRADLIRPLTPQEMQARKQPPPEAIMKLQAEQQQLQAKAQLEQLRIQGETEATAKEAQFQHQLDREKMGVERQMELDKLAQEKLIADQEATLAERKLQLDREIAILNAEIEREKIGTAADRDNQKVITELLKVLMDQVQNNEIVHEVERDAEGNMTRVKKVMTSKPS